MKAIMIIHTGFSIAWLSLWVLYTLSVDRMYKILRWGDICIGGDRLRRRDSTSLAIEMAFRNSTSSILSPHKHSHSSNWPIDIYIDGTFFYLRNQIVLTAETNHSFYFSKDNYTGCDRSIVITIGSSWWRVAPAPIERFIRMNCTAPAYYDSTPADTGRAGIGSMLFKKPKATSKGFLAIGW